jgi:chromate reductase, NAD(P)H dehydrogenase (quinone)
MKTYRIAVIVGSIRKESLNRKLAEAVVRLGPEDFTFFQVPIADLPPYNQDEENNPSEPVIRLKESIRGSNGLLLVTPEYNRSIPGVLKNAIDLASRPYGQSAWDGKPAGMIGISPGAPGTSMAQQHLRNILAFLDVPTLAQPEVFIQAKEGLFDETGGIGPASRPFLQGWMDRYTAWVRFHAAMA